MPIAECFFAAKPRQPAPLIVSDLTSDGGNVAFWVTMNAVIFRRSRIAAMSMGTQHVVSGHGYDLAGGSLHLELLPSQVSGASGRFGRPELVGSMAAQER